MDVSKPGRNDPSANNPFKDGFESPADQVDFKSAVKRGLANTARSGKNWEDFDRSMRRPEKAASPDYVEKKSREIESDTVAFEGDQAGPVSSAAAITANETTKV